MSHAVLWDPQGIVGFQGGRLGAVIDYANDDLGSIKWSYPIVDDRMDLKQVRIHGVDFPRYLRVDTITDLLGTVRLGIACNRNGIRIMEFAIVEPPRGRTIHPGMLERAAFELNGMARHALMQFRLTYADAKGGGIPFQKQVWEAIMLAMFPARGTGESASEYVYRLWTQTYQPEGFTQKQLAKDLGRSYDLIREYVSKEARKAQS